MNTLHEECTCDLCHGAFHEDQLHDRHVCEYCDDLATACRNALKAKEQAEKVMRTVRIFLKLLGQSLEAIGPEAGPRKIQLELQCWKNKASDVRDLIDVCLGDKELQVKEKP